MKNTDPMIYFLAVLENIATLVVFGLLAWYFNRWWIILFSLLNMNLVKFKSDNKANHE